MRNAGFYRSLIVATLLALGACATPPTRPLPAGDAIAARCERAYAALDRAVDEAGVRDAEATLVDGFPGVRVTRFLASFAEPAPDDATFRAWHARLVEEDRRARLVEIANLPPGPTQRALGALRDEGFATLPPLAFLEGCGTALAERDAADPVRRAALLAAARVPDDYDDAARALGLYPLTRVPAAAAIQVYEQRVLAAFGQRATAARPPLTWIAEGAPPMSADEVRGLLASGAADPLGVPALDDLARERLLATYAPVLVIDARDERDRLGRPVFAADGSLAFTPVPVVFGRVAYTRFAGRTRVQLVYTAWFAERAPAYPGDPLAGKLDGVLWRVTLDADGAPLVFDTIHACGCYPMFVPTARVHVKPREPTLDEQALIPLTLPALAVGDRVAVHLTVGTHQVRGVDVASRGPGGPGASRYRLGLDDALRSIALPGGGTRSLYGPDGIVEGTERGERALFWPLGVRNAGAMRQWGRHATAFVGRRHFDEAFLLDRYFLPAH